MATLDDVPFGQRPIGNMRQTGMDDSGNPVYTNALTGALFTLTAPQQNALARDYQATPYGQPTDRNVVNWTPDLGQVGNALGSMAGGMMQGFTAPRRAAMGETVTNGDVWATALDYGLLGSPMQAPAGAMRTGAMRDANPIFQTADDAFQQIKNEFGDHFKITTHPTQYGNSAYVSGRVPGPDGTYVDVGFRLSDHPTGDMRKATDGTPTILYDGSTTPDFLADEVRSQISRSQPQLSEIAARRAADEIARSDSITAWNALSGDQRGQVARSFQEMQPAYFNNRPWRSLSAQERANFAAREGLLSQDDQNALRAYLDQGGS